MERHALGIASAVEWSDRGFLIREDTRARSGDTVNWEMLIGDEIDGVDALAHSRMWLETELVRESDGVRGREAEGPYDPARERSREPEDAWERSLLVMIGAGTHPKRATMTAISEGITG